MIITCILGLILGAAIFAYADDDGTRMMATVLSILLCISVVFTAAAREEKGKAQALKATGWTEYTKTELYELSDKQKDCLVKTYDGFLGEPTYWKESE